MFLRSYEEGRVSFVWSAGETLVREARRDNVKRHVREAETNQLFMEISGRNEDVMKSWRGLCHPFSQGWTKQ